MHYDIVIIGGGLVGAGLALALRDLPLKIALVDAKLPHPEDSRLFALNTSTCHFLTHLGLWPRLQASAAPIHEVHVSTEGRLGRLRLKREELGLSSLGHVIPAYQIEAAMNDALDNVAAKNKLSLYRPAMLDELSQHSAGVNILLNAKTDHPTHLQTQLLIGADGTHSTVRQLLNIPTEEISTQQQAIVTRTSISTHHQQIAHERFTSHGTIAMLPLTDTTCATIWSAENNYAATLQAMPDDQFLEALQKAFGYTLGRLTAIEKRHHFPLKQVTAQRTVDQQVMLLGNAAHTVHPIAAQGLNLAMYEVATLVEALQTAYSQNNTISTVQLDKVAAAIQKQKTLSLGVSHHASRFMSHPSAIVGNIIQLSMISLNMMTPLKKQFIKRMLGQTGYVPRLLLGTNDEQTGY